MAGSPFAAFDSLYPSRVRTPAAHPSSITDQFGSRTDFKYFLKVLHDAGVRSGHGSFAFSFFLLFERS